MAYKKGMPRFKKEGKKYVAHEAGDYFKSDEGKYLLIGDADGSQEEETVTEDEFQKSLDALEEIAKSGDSKSRKDELLEKALTSGSLTEEENAELYKALGGDVEVDGEGEESVSQQLRKSFDESAGVQDALDVSEYIEAQHNALLEAFDRLGSTIEKSESRTQEFRLVFARALRQVGALVKSMDDRLEAIETQPARAPKSRGVAASGNVVEKGFAGEAPAEGQFSPGVILDSLEGLMVKSAGGIAPCGEDINLATAKYEQTKQISKGMLRDIVEYRKSATH